MKTLAVSMVALAGLAAVAQAQTYEAVGGRVSFQVFNGTSWTNSASINPGDTVQWRAVVDYVGTRTDLFGVGQVAWQAEFGNVDNAGGSLDNVSAGQGLISGNNASPSNMVPTADGQNGSALGLYGRVFPFGLAATTATASNIATVFRHSAGSNGAPAGEWLRVGGNGTSVWPNASGAPVSPVVAADLQAIIRGIQSNQSAQALAPTQWLGGTSGLVIFRGSFTASTDAPVSDRVVSIGSDQRYLNRWGNVSSTDNRRYMSWQTAAGDTGTGATGHRTGVEFVGGSITIVPTPASVALMGLGGLVAARRRRA